MVSAKKLIAMCLALPDTAEAPHFDRLAFRTPQRIYATLSPNGKSLNVRLTPIEQAALSQSRPEAFTPIDNAWGRQGWTTVTLKNVDEKTLADALEFAHAGALVPARSKAMTKEKKDRRKAPAATK